MLMMQIPQLSPQVIQQLRLQRNVVEKANIVEATKSASPQAKRLSVQKEPADEEKMEVDANGSNGGNGVPEKSDQLFDGCYFMLTSSARRPNGLF